MIGNTIFYKDGCGDEQKARVLDKILVVEESPKKKARGEQAYNSGFASSTRYLVVNLITKRILTLTPTRITKVL